MTRFPIQGVGSGGGQGGGGVERENVASPNDDFWIYDEFFYPTFSDIGLHLENVQASGSVPSGVGGLVQQNTNAVNNNDTRLNTCGAGGVAIDISKKAILKWRARMTVDNAFTAFICGFVVGGDGPQAPFPYVNKPGPIITFFYEGTGGASGNIDTYSATAPGGVNEEQTDTGVAMGTGFHTYEIEVDSGTITYKIDGNIVKVQTTNIPTGILGAWIGVQNGTTASRGIVIDSWFMFNSR